MWVFSSGPSLTTFPASIDGLWEGYLQKYEQPLVPSLPSEAGSHLGKLAFRLTVPALAWVFGFQKLGTYVLLGVAGMLSCLMAAEVFKRVCADRVTALGFVLLFAGTHAASLFWRPSTGFFDGIAFMFIWAAFWFRRWYGIALVVVLGGFTDERALLAFGFVPLLSLIELDDAGTKVADFRRFAKEWCRDERVVGSFLGLMIWIALRWLIAASTPLHANLDEVQFLFALRFHAWLPVALWSGMQAGWVALGWALWSARARPAIPLVVGMYIMFGLVSALSVYDVTRSIAYLFPLLVVVASLVRRLPHETVRHVVFVLAGACLLEPNMEVIGSLVIQLPLYPVTLAHDILNLF